MANIQVILTEKIEGLGAEADVVKVRGGYARNFLLPNGHALEATRSNLRHTESLKAKRAERESKELAAAGEVAAGLMKKKIKLELTTGQGGKAFGSITSQDIAAAVQEQLGKTIDRHGLELEKPIKTTGEHKIDLRIHPQVTATLTIEVSAKSEEAAAE